MGKAGIKYIYKEVEYDSPEEIGFAQWLEELEQKGFITQWKRNTNSFEITPPVVSSYRVKNKYKTQSILQNYTYSHDFDIQWNKKSLGIFVNKLNVEKITQPFICDDNLFSYVEIKPSFDRNNMTRLFRHTQKILYNFFSLYINLIEITKLFNSTFTPNSQLFTKRGKKRKISKWQIKSLDEYIRTVESRN